MRFRTSLRAGACLLIPCLTVSAVFASALTFEERVAAQRAIDEVYWRHRIWPSENPGPKPSLDLVLPDEAIREKVDDYMKKSAALDNYWDRAVTNAQLQAEIDRMAKQTRQPGILKELFAALAEDPTVVAECLAKPALVDRLIRSWYAFDGRFHGALRTQARAELGPEPTIATMQVTSGQYGEVLWIRGEQSEAPDGATDEEGVPLAPDEFDGLIASLAHRFSPDASAPPLGVVSSLGESESDFDVVAVLDRQADTIRVATTTWAKKPFDDWWAEARNAAPAIPDCPDRDAAVTPPLPAITGTECPDDDTWKGPVLPEARSGHTAVWTGSEMIVWGGSSASSWNLSTGGRYNPATDSWTPTSTRGDVPTGRSRHTAVWTGLEMIVWGGPVAQYPQRSTAGGRYNPATDTWAPTSIGDNVPVDRYGHTAVWTGTEMIVWGGWRGSPTSLTAGGRYNPGTDSWTPTSTGANVPESRRLHTAVWTGSEMIVWGGDAISPPYEHLNTGARYNPKTGAWTPTSTADDVPSGRSGHAAVWTGSEMIVWGGTGAWYPRSETGGRYDPAIDSWRPTSTDANAPAARENFSAVWTGSEMIVWGGKTYYERHAITGGRYDPSTDTWLPTSTGGNAPFGRLSHTAIWTGAEMIVWGGEGDYPYLHDTGGRYDPASDSWTPTSTGPEVVSGRVYHTAVWTGMEMIVWGGYGATRTTNTGGRFNPATATWTPTSVGANVSAARDRFSAVWTGTEMIVWGGRTDSGYYSSLNTGGRYNPATDSWRPTSVGFNVPDRRHFHTAVWTGAEMIVWGGYNSTNYAAVNTGGRYNPAADSWTPTSTGDNAPRARYSHTAVWTGNEMIIWGGYGTLIYPPYLNTGGRYDPANDTWTPTSIGENVPDGRIYHTAVWTGSEMIVWGGQGSYPYYLNTGGRYDPTTDSWTPTSTGDGAPTGRAYHAAVWTRFEMIVWGGYNANVSPNYPNTGARYSPAMDAWMPTSVDGAPGGRTGPTGVWTGAEMIVWGGYNGKNYVNAGGRYRACLGRHPPVAEAGPDQVVECTGDLGALVTLDGSASYDDGSSPGTNDDIVYFLWYAHESPFAEGEIVTAPFGLGSHPVQLLVLDTNAAFSVDPVTIGVADSHPPAVTCPEGAAPIADDACCAPWAGQATTVDVCDPSPVTSSSPRPPFVFCGRGDHPIVFTGRDSAGNSSSCTTNVEVVDQTSPRGEITFPPGGSCFGQAASGVTVLDNFTDNCNVTLARTYAPAGGPSYTAHGDYDLQLTVSDSSDNAAVASDLFTIDLIPPTVQIQDPPAGHVIVPSAIPMALLFTTSDEDGAAGGVIHEVVKLQDHPGGAYCAVYDGWDYGDGDGLLTDESLDLSVGEFCRLAKLCGFTTLSRPEIRVEAEDCGHNWGVATRRLEGALRLWPGLCTASGRGSASPRPPAPQAPATSGRPLSPKGAGPPTAH